MEYLNPEKLDFVDAYIAPIMIHGDFKKVVENYKLNKRLSLREQMRKAGVFESLKRLEEQGSSFDQVMSTIRHNINREKYYPDKLFTYKLFNRDDLNIKKISDKLKNKHECFLDMGTLGTIVNYKF